LFRSCRREVLFVAGLGILGGGSSAVIIAIVNSILHRQTASRLLIAGFVLAVVCKLASALVANVVLLHMTQDCTLRLCDELCRHAIAAPFRRIEAVGIPRLLTSLTDDVSALSAAIEQVPHLIVNSAVLIGCAVYLAWLSWHAAIGMSVIVLIGSFCYRLLLARAHKAFENARDWRDVLFRHFRSLTEGIKELKLNRQRRETFFKEDLGRSVDQLRKHSIVAVKYHIFASAWSQSVFYALLALLLFVLPSVGIVSREALTAYVFVALFTTAPLWAVIAALPALSRGQTALDRIGEVGISLGSSIVPAHSGGKDVVPEQEHLIEFRQVQFTYGDNGSGGGFALGPLDLTLYPGELVFVTGGNGSGKSTFVKVLTGLYAPDGGEIRINGRSISASNNEQYRELFAVVYSDFYLFDRLPGMPSDKLLSDAYKYLSMLKLDHKVRIV